MQELKKTTCNRDCPDTCGIVATVQDGRVVKLGGDPDHPVTRGFLCYRTNHYLETQYSPDRLRSPLYRERLGEPFREVSWDEGLDLAARRLVEIRAESGPDAIAHYRGGGSLGLVKHVCDHFFSLFGPVTTLRGDICSGSGDFAQTTDFGDEDSNDIHELVRARHILLWGRNVFVSSPHTIPRLEDAKARGARLVLIDPVHHRTARLCQAYVQPRPGGDLALALAAARVLFERGWVSPQAAASCDHVDGFRALAFSRELATWCRDADVPVTAAEDLAHRLHDGPTAILVGWGLGRRMNGAAAIRALDALCVLSGNLGVAGGGVTFYFKRRGAFDTELLATRPPPRTLSQPLFGHEVLEAKDPPIRAVWITAGNPVAMLPESATTARALETRDFVVVVDPFLTDTAKRAHLVLPTTTMLEADDILGSYGHHYLGVARPVVSPPPGILSDLEIMQGLAARVGLAEALAGDARAWKRRLTSKKLATHGVTLETLEAGPVRNPLAPPVIFPGGKVKTASGRVNLMTELPGLPIEEPFGPLWLLSVSTDKSQSSQWVRPPSGPAVVTVHPESAAGIADGGTGRLVSPIGSLAVEVRHDPLQRRDVALMAKGGHFDAVQASRGEIASSRRRRTSACSGSPRRIHSA